MRFSLKVAAATVAIAGVAAGVGQAAISNDGVVITCVSNTTGAMRAVEPQANGRPCANTETVLTLNQKGPAGPAGPAGPQGVPGPVSLPSVTAKWIKGDWWPTTSFYPAAKLVLGRGAYHVTAKGGGFVHEIPGTTWWSAVTCQLRISHPTGEEILDSATFEISEDGPEFGTFTLQGVTRIDTNGTETVRLECKDDGGVGGEMTVLRNLNLHAMQIGGYTQTQG